MEPEEPVAEPVGQNDDLNVEETVSDIASALRLNEPEEGEGTDSGAEAPTPPATGTEVPPAPDDASAPPIEGTPPPDLPPDTWRKEAKEAWATLPPVVREELRKREGDIAKFVSDTQPAITISQSFAKVIEPYVGFFTQNNIDPWKYTNAVIGAHMTLLHGRPEQRVNTLRRLAVDAGIDLSAMAQGLPPDRVQDAAVQRINQLENHIRQLEGGVTQVTSAVQEARQAELESAVVAFSKDPKNPYFSEVADDIQALIEAKAARSLEEAYHLAVQRNPVTRQKVIDAAVAARSQNLGQLERARAAKAAKAASANVRSTKSGQRGAPAVGSIDDTLREAMAEINSR